MEKKKKVAEKFHAPLCKGKQKENKNLNLKIYHFYQSTKRKVTETTIP